MHTCSCRNPDLREGLSGFCAAAWRSCAAITLDAVPPPDQASLRYFSQELARLELAGRISEFHALGVHAVLSLVEEPELASAYLDMAALVASSPGELALLHTWRAITERCVARAERTARPDAPLTFDLTVEPDLVMSESAWSARACGCRRGVTQAA